MKILLAVDGSKPSTHAAKWVATNATLFAAPLEIVLLHAGQRLLTGVEQRLGRAETKRYYAGNAEHALRAARRILARGGHAFVETFLLGDTADVIARAARRERCDVVVLGSRGHGAVRQALLGSVAAKVIARSTVPVVVVR